MAIKIKPLLNLNAISSVTLASNPTTANKNAPISQTQTTKSTMPISAADFSSSNSLFNRSGMLNLPGTLNIGTPALGGSATYIPSLGVQDQASDPASAAATNSGAGTGIYKDVSVAPLANGFNPNFTMPTLNFGDIAIPTSNQGVGIFGAVSPTTSPASSAQTGESTILGNLFTGFVSDMAKMVPAPAQKYVSNIPGITPSVSQNPGSSPAPSSGTSPLIAAGGILVALRLLKII